MVNKSILFFFVPFDGCECDFVAVAKCLAIFDDGTDKYMFIVEKVNAKFI